MLLKIRPWYLYGFLLGAFGLGLAGYLQVFQGIEPCPLCMLTRFILILLCVVFLVAFFHNPGPIGKWIYITLTTFLSVIGLAITARHVWLQHLPTGDIPACGPGFDYLLETFPLFTALGTMLKGSGECSEVLWTFGGLSLPTWAGLGFVIFAIISVLPAFDSSPK